MSLLKVIWTGWLRSRKEASLYMSLFKVVENYYNIRRFYVCHEIAEITKLYKKGC